MDVPQLSTDLIQQLSSWFFRKDRSIVLAPSTFAYLPNQDGYLVMAFISETVLSGNATSVTFSNIVQSFRSLVLQISARTDRAATTDTAALRFNSDSGANYDTEVISGVGAGLTSSTSRGATSVGAVAVEGANSRGNNFSGGDVWIFDYSRTVEKYFLSLGCNIGDLSADTELRLQVRSGHWRNTTVVTSIVLIPGTGTNFVSGSRFSLYGIL